MLTVMSELRNSEHRKVLSDFDPQCNTGMRLIGKQLPFQDDNDSKHSANAVKAYLNTKSTISHGLVSTLLEQSGIILAKN